MMMNGIYCGLIIIIIVLLIKCIISKNEGFVEGNRHNAWGLDAPGKPGTPRRVTGGHKYLCYRGHGPSADIHEAAGRGENLGHLTMATKKGWQVLKGNGGDRLSCAEECDNNLDCNSFDWNDQTSSGGNGFCRHYNTTWSNRTKEGIRGGHHNGSGSGGANDNVGDDQGWCKKTRFKQDSVDGDGKFLAPNKNYSNFDEYKKSHDALQLLKNDLDSGLAFKPDGTRMDGCYSVSKENLGTQGQCSV